jgi:hypothetical protein
LVDNLIDLVIDGEDLRIIVVRDGKLQLLTIRPREPSFGMGGAGGVSR